MQTDYLHRMYASVILVHTPEAIWYGRSWNASEDICPSASIPDGTRESMDGVLRWKINHENWSLLGK